MGLLRQFLDDESGATAIEYGLIATLVSLAIVVSVGELANALRDYWEDIGEKVANPTAP
jgi:pilus assembly protein Flp/PilA